jgi:purine-binding chemotaxis protein CheW
VDAFLAFRVASVWLAVPAERIDEIGDQPDVTPVPLVPRHIPGVMNLRGHAIPLLDLDLFLGLGRATSRGEPDGEPGTSFRRVAVAAAAGMTVGLLCDQVRGVIEVPRSLQKRPEVVKGERIAEFALAEVQRDDSMLVVLDLERLLHAARVQR